MFSNLSEEQVSRLILLGQLTSSIAHEINNPLNQISLQAELMQLWVSRQTVTSEKVQLSAQQILSTVDRIAKIIKNIKYLMGDGNTEACEQIHAKSWLEESTVWFHSVLNQKNIHLKIDILPAELEFKGRPFQLMQILSNLLNNAIEAVSTHNDVHKWIEIKIHETQNELLIMVTNSGDKIPSEVAQKIFDPYFSTKNPKKNLGVGLKISRLLAQKNSASLRLDTDCKNTRFILEIKKDNQYHPNNS